MYFVYERGGNYDFITHRNWKRPKIMNDVLLSRGDVFDVVFCRCLVILCKNRKSEPEWFCRGPAVVRLFTAPHQVSILNNKNWSQQPENHIHPKMFPMPVINNNLFMSNLHSRANWDFPERSFPKYLAVINWWALAWWVTQEKFSRTITITGQNFRVH